MRHPQKYGSARDLATFDTQIRRGVGLSGLAAQAGGYGYFAHDFETIDIPGWTKQVGSGANSSAVTTARGGVRRMDSTVTAGGNIQFISTGYVIQNLKTDRWYVGCRVALITAMGANVRAGIGFENGGTTNALELGAFGGLSATNWVLQYDGVRAGSMIDLGVAADATFRVLEAWCVGDGVFHAAIDGVEKSPALAPVNGTNGFMWHDVYNNGAALQVQFDTDWVVYCFPR